MESSVPCCLLCGAALPASASRRSVLSDQGTEVKRVVEDYVWKILNSGKVLEVTSGMESSVDDLALAYMKRSTVLCKNSCFASVTRLLEKANCFQNLNSKLEGEVNKTLSAFMLDFASPANAESLSSPSVNRKRTSSMQFDGTPSRKRLKKELMNTPTRLFVDSTIVDNNSAVAVSCMHTNTTAT